MLEVSLGLVPRILDGFPGIEFNQGKEIRPQQCFIPNPCGILAQLNHLGSGILGAVSKKTDALPLAIHCLPGYILAECITWMNGDFFVMTSNTNWPG